MLFALRNFQGSVNQYQLHNHITTFLKKMCLISHHGILKSAPQQTTYRANLYSMEPSWNVHLFETIWCHDLTACSPRVPTVYFNKMKSFFLWYDSRVVCDVSDSIEISLRINRTYFTNLLQLNERPKRFQRKSSAGVVQNALNSSWQFSSHTRE